MATNSQGLLGNGDPTMGFLGFDDWYSWHISHLDIISSICLFICGQKIMSLALRRHFSIPRWLSCTRASTQLSCTRASQGCWYDNPVSFHHHTINFRNFIPIIPKSGVCRLLFGHPLWIIFNRIIIVGSFEVSSRIFNFPFCSLKRAFYATPSEHDIRLRFPCDLHPALFLE